MNIFTGDVTLSTPSELQDFKLAGYNRIEGSLRVAGTDENRLNINDLNSLANLDSISGDFTLAYTSGLSNLNGLSNLEFIGGSFNLFENQDLTNMNGLNGLEDIVHRISVSNNPRLTAITGFDNINSLNESVSIFNNDALSSFTLPPSILTLTNLGISNNDNLQTIDLSSNLTVISEFFGISENQSLTTITGVSGLVQKGTISFNDNPQLTRIDTFEGIESCFGLILSDNTSLPNLDAFKPINVLTYGPLIINGNHSLINLNGLADQIEFSGGPRANSVGPIFNLADNENLEDASSLSIKETVFSDFLIGVNPKLQAIPQFEEEISVTTLTVYDLSSNLSLQDLSMIKGDIYELRILENKHIASLDGLEISAIKRRVTINNNPNLVDFCAIQGDKLEDSISEFEVDNNAYNPTLEELKAGDCN